MSKNSKKRTSYLDRALIRLHRVYGQDELVLSLKNEISNQDIEIGKLKSYIDELEYTIKEMKRQDILTPEEKFEIKKDEKVAFFRNQHNKLAKSLNACRKDKEQLIIKLNAKKIN